MVTEKKDPLYCVAFNERVRTPTGYRWVPAVIRYVHAPDAVTAKNAAIRSTRNRIDVIGVAPAIGYFVEDNHGEKLSAG